MDKYYFHRQNCLFAQQPMTRGMMNNCNQERCNKNAFTGIQGDDIIVENNKDGTTHTLTYCPTEGFTTC